MNKSFFLLLVLLVSFFVAFVPYVKADYAELGLSIGYAGGTGISTDQLFGYNVSTSSLSDGVVYRVISGRAFIFEDLAGATYCKFVLLAANRSVLAVSDPELVPAGSSSVQEWVDFYFPETVYVNKDEGYYGLCVVDDGGMTIGTTGSGVVSRISDTSNSYSSPVSPDVGDYGSTTRTSIYLTLETYVVATPTPSPSPVVTYPPNNVGVQSVPSYYMVILVLFAVVAVLAGIYVGFERDGGNKGVAFLFALVALVIFVVLIVGYLSG